MRKLRGRDVQIMHGLAESSNSSSVSRTSSASRPAFLDGLVSHFVLDDGKLVVAHAGMKEGYQGRASGRVRDFALFGETTGETDEFGLPVRFDVGERIPRRGDGRLRPHAGPEPEWLNNTINIDTGCVFGGRLTALALARARVRLGPAARVYYEPRSRSWRPTRAAAGRRPTGPRPCSTSTTCRQAHRRDALHGNVTFARRTPLRRSRS